MTTVLNGRYYDGATAQDVPMRLSVDATGHLSAEPPLLTPGISLASLTIDPRIAGLPAVLRFASGALFETPQHDTVDRLLRAHGQKTSLAHQLERRNRYALLSIVVAVGMLAGLIRWGIPAFSSLLAPLVPLSVENKIGAHSLAQMDRFLLKPSELPEQRRTELMAQFETLAKQVASDLPLRLELRRGGNIVNANAFALPGGTIVFTDEIITLAENDTQVAAVMLHEIGHVRHRHLMQRLLGDAAITVLSFILFGDASSGASFVIALPTLLMEMSYSRTMELEADDYSVRGMHALGLDPEQFAGMLTRLDAYVHWCMGTRRNQHDETDTPCTIAAYIEEHLRGAVTSDPTVEPNAEKKRPEGWTVYTETHPGISDRITQLHITLGELLGKD